MEARSSKCGLVGAIIVRNRTRFDIALNGWTDAFYQVCRRSVGTKQIAAFSTGVHRRVDLHDEATREQTGSRVGRRSRCRVARREAWSDRTVVRSDPRTCHQCVLAVSFATTIRPSDSADLLCSIARPSRERVGWDGKQWEMVRGEKPVRKRISRVSPGQPEGSSRAHDPKVAGSNPAPATKKTLGIPTFSRVFSRGWSPTTSGGQDGHAFEFGCVDTTVRTGSMSPYSIVVVALSLC